MVTVDVKNDVAVVVITTENGDDIVLGFPHLYSAIALIERQVNDDEKSFSEVQAAMTEEGTELKNNRYKVMDLTTYLDLYEDSDNDEE